MSFTLLVLAFAFVGVVVDSFEEEEELNSLPPEDRKVFREAVGRGTPLDCVVQVLLTPYWAFIGAFWLLALPAHRGEGMDTRSMHERTVDIREKVQRVRAAEIHRRRAKDQACPPPP